MPTPSTQSYDSIPDFGLLYDSVPAYAERRDVPFYVAEAARAPGAVLELGCGTGRVLLPIARNGTSILGLDGSREMLARCETKLAAEPESTRARVTLHRADSRDFDLGSTFGLIIAPFRMLQHLVAIDDQLRCLASVARHLAPGGRFIFDVFNPNLASLARDRSAEEDDTPEQSLPDGRSMRRAARVTRVRQVEQVSEVELIYYLSDHAGSPPSRHVQAFDMRWYLRAELVHLLARGGFRVTEIYGDFDRSPLVDGSPEQVVCAELDRGTAR